MALEGINTWSQALGMGGAAGLGREMTVGAAAETQAPGGFKDLFLRVLQETNDLQLNAERMTEKLLTGQVEDVSQVMIAAQKAELSLQLAIQMRNKLVEAYQEIMRMPV